LLRNETEIVKIASVNYSDQIGGAARAAYRIHWALRTNGIDSILVVNQASSDDWTVCGPESHACRAAGWVRPRLGKVVGRLLKSQNPVLHSPAIVPSRWSAWLNKADVDVVNLHWVNGEMISVADIGRLQKPAVWTLHDMWAFCGAEHVTTDRRWKEGYTASNRPSHETGVDLNRWTWYRKVRHWKRPMEIVTPSRWLADCVRASRLMHHWPVRVIPNAIDVRTWAPVERAVARRLLGLPQDVPLLLFGGAKRQSYPRHKGFDLLAAALEHLRGELQGLEVVIFGQSAPKVPLVLGFPVHYAGHLYDDISLRLFYCAADALVIPSRLDNLPNTGLEAHACGCPVVAFDTCGLADVVKHRKTGYLARAFDTFDLAVGIRWVLDAQRNAGLGSTARARAVETWSYPVVARAYEDAYRATLSRT
jgi:glycosyltransferase involved in cell wall biosynthesis